MEENKKEKEVDIIVFDASTSKDLKIDYPELAEIEEFKLLQPNELKFIWYIANRTSPLFNLSREEKVAKALSILFPRGYGRFQNIVKLSKGEFSPEILAAIERMTHFQTENRLKAMLLADYTFQQLQRLIYIDESEMKLMDMEEKKKYSDLLMKVQKELPSVIKNLESGFGVKVNERSTGKKILVSMKNLG